MHLHPRVPHSTNNGNKLLVDAVVPVKSPPSTALSSARCNRKSSPIIKPRYRFDFWKSSACLFVFLIGVSHVIVFVQFRFNPNQYPDQEYILTNMLTNNNNAETVSTDAVVKLPKVAEKNNSWPSLLHLELRNASTDLNTYDPTRSQRQVIFYNIFIPTTAAGKENALRIVREQLGQVRRSYSASRGKLVVFFVTLGQANVLTEQFMLHSEYCGPDPDVVSCRHLMHYTAGSEVLTLGHLYNFCHTHVAAKVTYIHNKGSFHYLELNENWRPPLTDAALSRMCVDPEFYGDPDCNVCGLNFFAQWTPFFPGNMFTARCDYVQQLVPPPQWQDRLEQAIHQVILLRLRGQIVTTTLPDREDRFGLGRYSDEHWIASHPHVRPCDCDPWGSVARYTDEKHTLADLNFSTAPKRALLAPDSYVPAYKRLLQARHEADRVREYYLMAGNLIKWTHIYNEIPPPESWVWRWFPDGEMWHAAAKQYGSEAVNRVTQSYAHPAVLKVPTFSQIHNYNNSLQIFRQQHATDKGSTQSSAVFYNVILSNENEYNLEQHSLIKDQLSIINESKLRVVYFTTTGSPRAHLIVMESCHELNLQCHHLGHYTTFYRGETLRFAHEYCQHQPPLPSSQRIHFISNVAPNYISEDVKSRLVRHLTMAVMSQQCQQMMNNQDENDTGNTCNVCGLLVYTIPTLLWVGNMFVADCAYVNKLLPPVQFEERMRTFIAKAVIAQIFTRLQFQILDRDIERLGLDGYSMDHWIGSHPELHPCDVSGNQQLNFWLAQPRDASQFTAVLGAHPKDGAPFGTPRMRLVKVRRDESLRMREFHFLPGNLLKWFTLYGSAPPGSSWVWSYYPDGDKWLRGVQDYGSQAIDIVTYNYTNSGVLK